MKVNSKTQIINILKQNPAPISGELLSSKIGISRTAIWKNINSLISQGYNIEKTNNGYQLIQEEDLLLPMEFKEDEELYIYKKSMNSTMFLARDLIHLGKAKNWSVVLTEEQESGISKDGSRFNSPLGGLYFTIIVKPNNLALKDVNLPPMAGVIAINEILSKELEIPIQSRWPFETWSNNIKISGILHDFSVISNKVSWVTVGIGIYTGFKIPRREILEKIKFRIKDLLSNPGQILPLYIKKLDIIGFNHTFLVKNIRYQGLVNKIDRLGTLELRTFDSSKNIYIGDSTQED
ncbi:HTH domain-containing protein [Thiospirochaeta perfilievii]|uniref:HTH domain-containing protein n=1 Tax=Thiospirochaeta perfilievii TaxID=252967 RepID=A0A5C1QBU0_9SPIO|nr:HTH domain-containing protein [Thiospirochaeta perfilievii]QEN05545.1 HTH domain-containing protein [Thiospirochaeta perfilievii]